MVETIENPGDCQSVMSVRRSGLARVFSRRTTNRGQRGGALVEAALVASLLYAPLLIGLVVVGLQTINRLQLDQLVRDVGIMHARGMDFQGSADYDLFLKLTEGTHFSSGTPGSYNGTIIISTVRLVSPLDCSSCTNMNQPVVTFRHVLGDPLLLSSEFGQPANLDTQGRVVDWRNDTSARADRVLLFINGMQPGDEAYIAEGYMRTPGVSFPSVNAQAEVRSWAIF